MHIHIGNEIACQGRFPDPTLVVEKGYGFHNVLQLFFEDYHRSLGIGKGAKHEITKGAR
jgi:hypothetical protein